jgi:hypothetical protein
MPLHAEGCLQESTHWSCQCARCCFTDSLHDSIDWSCVFVFYRQLAWEALAAWAQARPRASGSQPAMATFSGGGRLYTSRARAPRFVTPGGMGGYIFLRRPIQAFLKFVHHCSTSPLLCRSEEMPSEGRSCHVKNLIPGKTDAQLQNSDRQ